MRTSRWTRVASFTGLIGAALLAACTSDVSSEASSDVDEALTSATFNVAIGARTGRHVDPQFLGLSMEWQTPRFYGDANGNPDPRFVQLLKNLGGGTFRIGGDSTDGAGRFITPLGEPSHTEVQWVKNVSTETGNWSAMFGIGFGQYVDKSFVIKVPGQPDKPGHQFWTEMASYIEATQPRSQLLGLELGNEPECGGPQKQPAYPSNYLSAWNGEVSGLKNSGVSGPFIGSASCAVRSYFDQAANDANVSIATFHVYTYTKGANGQNPASKGFVENVIKEVLSPDKAKEERQTFEKARSDTPAGKKLQMGEGNIGLALASHKPDGSTNCGTSANPRGCICTIPTDGSAEHTSDLTGIGDGVTATIWGLDYIFNAAGSGVDRINFHTLPDCAGVYNAISLGAGPGHPSNDIRAMPLYYAMLAAAPAAGGALRAVSHDHPEVNVQFHAVEKGNSVLLYVINKTLDKKATIDISDQGYASAKLLVVGGTKLTDTGPDAVQYGGRVADPATGKIPAVSESNLPRQNGRFRFELGVAHAAVVTLTK